ncbi:MAG: ATP-binding cassette domain-containing protein [Clostridiaceae bacterium]|nr:ATP-binding cassette domain-containing protein [Clostridiaceae bacterium]MBW4860668.1 ATP-binding cassette domain-containing protein [Clostridiaceae bacterium]MBW4868964.1 ATP-binding cassette domain-containing protein [Clostridiaceae bacterium]
MEIINFNDVSFLYPLCKKKAIKNLNIKIYPSEFIVVCGKSGCGKSTLLRLMKQELAPDGDLLGEVLYNGLSIEELSPFVSASEIGFVHQSPEKQIVTDKVWHELAFGLESLGIDNKIIRNRVAEMASFFGIQTWFRKSIFELSGGQKQILNLASVMAMHPKVLILDEPTSQLDPIASTEFISTLRKINLELGTTIILSEHRLEEVFPIADKVLLMEEGEAEVYGTPLEVGDFLSSKYEEHPMYEGLPTAMKVYSKVCPEGDCPITVRDGKIWLTDLLGNELRIKKINSEENSYKKEPIIQIKDVWFRYSKNGNDVIRDLSLTVNKGELFAIIGGNGVGKSTLLKLITGTNRAYRGKVIINDKEIKKYKYNELFTENLCMLPQNPKALFTEVSALEELLDMVEDSKGTDDEKLNRAKDMLECLGLSHLSDMHSYDLSGGEQQRLALGKVLLLNPKILLLDEPTKGLDPFYKKVLAKIFKELQEEGVTIVMVSHDIEFCARHFDRCAMLFDGTVISEDTPRELFSSNSFYTTASNRMSKHLFKNAITCEDVIQLCEQNMIQNVMS